MNRMCFDRDTRYLKCPSSSLWFSLSVRKTVEFESIDDLSCLYIGRCRQAVLSSTWHVCVPDTPRNEHAWRWSYKNSSLWSCRNNVIKRAELENKTHQFKLHLIKSVYIDVMNVEKFQLRTIEMQFHKCILSKEQTSWIIK